MRFWAPQQTIRISVSALVTVLALGVGEAAQAACYGSGQQLPAQVVSRFTNDPGQLLTQFPGGGPQMISLIRDLVASNPVSLALILDLSANANTRQVQALGTGLGQAALICARTVQGFANEIEQMTVAVDNQPLTLAFASVMGDLYLSSPGPAGAGGGGGPTATNGAIGGTAASGAPLNLATSVPTASGHFFTFSLSFTPRTPGSSGNSGSPGSSGGQGGSRGPGNPGGPSSLVSPNTNIVKSVSPSRP